MPRKKKPGKQGGGSEASSKHAKHAKNAGAGPAGGKGRKKVDKEETRAQSLQQLQDMFEGKLDAVLVHMIMEDCNYNVDNALETLFKLAGDASNPAASDMSHLPEKPRDLVSYSRSEDSDESEDVDGFPNGLYLPHHVTPGETVAGSGTDAKRPLSSANGVGLDDISLPHRINGLDFAISMAKDLDRNTFSEESVEKVTAGLLAYRDTGDRNKLKELGNLRAIAEMVLEVGVKEEEKERAESSKVQFKSLHSRLPVYSATDDRLVGGLSSSSGSSGSSSPSQSDDERDKPDGPYPAEDAKNESESKEAGYEAAESKEAGARALSHGTPRTAPTESSEKPQENPSLNNGDPERRLPSTNPNLSNISKNYTTLSATENRNDEVASARPKATVSFWNNLTPEQGETDDASDEDSEKDIDKHISFQEDSESYRGDRPERDSCHDIASSERSNLLKSQQLAKPNNSTERSHDVYPPGGENLNAPFSVERPLKQPDERFFGNEIGQGPVDMSLTRPQQRLSDIPQGPVQVENNQFSSQYSPLNASPAATNLHGKHAHKPFVYDANFAPGFGMGTTHFFVRNMSPGLLPRTYRKDGQPPQKSSQPWPNQGYSRAFYAQMPPGTATKNSAYPPHNIFSFQGPRLRSPTIPRSNVTITELPDSPEEPLTSTNVEEVYLGPPRWPVIQQTNLKRHEYPAQSPRKIPPLPPGKVLCLMRGCPGSGKSTVAKSLKGNGVVLSTDDFFIVRGKYMFDRNLVGEAHDWNHARAQEYLAKGTTPIIVDNTNIMTWEMKPYVAMALKHKYQVVIREPDTPWKNKAGELAKRNSHGVPKTAIERMLQNYDPKVTVESIMSGPDKKKTPEYVAKLNQEDPDLPGEDGKPPRVSRVSGHQGGQQGGHQGGQTRRGDGGRSHHQDNAPGDEKVIDDEGWERVGRHSKGDQWNHQRGGRDGRKDLNQRNNLKSGSPRRYNNEHPANRYQDGGEDARASGKTKNGPYNGPSKAQSPSRSVRTPPRDRGGMRRDGPQHDDEGWISSPKRGKRSGGSPSPSPNRAYQNKRNPKSPQRGQQNQGKHAAPKSQHNKPSDAAIRFLESDESLPQDPMKRLINHIGTASQTLTSSIGKKRSLGKTDQNGKALENGERQKHVASPVSSRPSQPQSGMPTRQDLIQEVTIGKTMASDTESLLLNTQLSSSDDQKGSSSASAASLQEDPALDGDEKTYGMLLAENLKGDIDRSLDMPGKIDLSVDVTTRSEEDISLHSHSDYGRNINLTGRDSPQCDVRKTASDNPIKKMDAEQSPPLKGHFMTNCTEVQNSEGMWEKPKSEGVGRIEAEVHGHTSCQGKERDCSTVEGPPLISPVEIEDRFEYALKTKHEAISPLKNEEETISPSQCRSRESSRASTPSLRRTTRRLSGGQSTRRLAAVFTSPTSPDPPGPVNADWSKYDPSRSIPKPMSPDPPGSVKTDWSKYDPSRSMPKPTSPDPPGSVNTDWAKYDPSRSIPKPTFPIIKQETAAVRVNLCDKSTEINGQDFAFLQRIISGTMEPEDLPTGYVCRSAVARLLSRADKSGGNETGGEEDQDRSSPIPLSVKLHKSCMTEEIVEETNLEDEKVSRMQGCFPASSAKDLQSLLETCNGDVEMATNLLLDSLALGAASSPEDRSTPKDEVPTKATETSHGASANLVSGNKVVVAEELAAGNDHGISFPNDQTGKEEMQSRNDALRVNSPDNLPTSQGLDNDTVPSDMSASRHDALKQLASDSQRFASELKQANQIFFSNDLKTHTEQTPERPQPRPCDANSKTNDTDKRTMTVEMNDTAKSDVHNSKDSEFHKQEGESEQQEQEQDTDSEDLEFSNNFYSGASKLLKPKTADTSDDELPPLESFREDRQMLQLAAACHNRDNVVHGHSPIKENPLVPLHEPSEILPVTLDKPAPEQVREETINPALQTEDCVTPQTKPDLPATSGAKVEGVHATLCSDQLTPQPEPESQRVDEDDSKDLKDLLELGKEDSQTGTLLSTLLSGPNSTMSDPRDNERMAGGVSYGQDPKTNDQESGKSSPKLQRGMERPEGDIGDNSVRFGASLEEPSMDELSDSDIPWKSGFDVIEPGADREAAVGDPLDKFTDSGEGVYDYLGGMELQMDAAFALQLQELFGQVGFHLDPDMLSADALKVKIGYQVAKQLHSAWSTGLAERFQDQERQVEEMLQRDEELARRLQQEENLKKLAKSHRDKKPTTKGISSPGGSPKWNKRRQKEPEVANGGQEGMRGEQLLVGGGLRNLGGLGAVGGAGSPGKYPPPVQRVEVPELAQIMAEEELRQEREKKGMWSSPSPVRANTIATKLKRDQLFEAFPDVDRNALDEIFKANNYEFQSTVWEVNAVFREPAGPVKEVFSPEALVEMEKRRDSSPARRKAKGQSDSTDGQFQSTEQPDYEDYRAEATLHFKQRDECFKKAAKAYHAGQKELAVHYSNQGRLHSMRLKEANRRAAELILVQRRHVTGENKLDLHNLHVEEALQALQEVLIERQMHPSPGQHRYLEVVTGRGKHSKMGVAKLKPAVCKFLEQKGYSFTAPNAGCLKVDV
ncbi:uncharacterized protein LOC100891052 [Strongylocentrotus purpuratus]|uniref:Smr domain-containing protein n=1 Tax=Strongylocentrotus purpuratus TaxID=7668 RepID=A0A7M7NHN1_STRPU|nr:uncharacterized protein LOC100891052 [Strongylocentrotus purpuratus]